MSIRFPYAVFKVLFVITSAGSDDLRAIRRLLFPLSLLLKEVMTYARFRVLPFSLAIPSSRKGQQMRSPLRQWR